MNVRLLARLLIALAAVALAAGCILPSNGQPGQANGINGAREAPTPLVQDSPAAAPESTPPPPTSPPLLEARPSPSPAEEQAAEDESPEEVDIQPLGQRIRGYLDRDQQHFGIVVKDPEEGVIASLNSRRVFYAASLFKLPIMYETFRQRDAGLLDFDEALTVTAAHAEWDLGTLSAVGIQVGDRVPVERLVEVMITASDNASAHILAGRLGWANVDRAMGELGLQSTVVASADLPTTAGDMALLLGAVASGEAVSPSASAEMAELLKRQGVRDRIPAGLPEDVDVGNKTGDWVDAVHDVAIVYAPSGSYVLAILSDGSAPRSTFIELSELVYEYFLEAAATDG